jgi:WD40 repeat protein
LLCIGSWANETNASVECWSIEGNTIRPHGAYGLNKGAGAGGLTGAANSTRVAFLEASISHNAFTENTTIRQKRYLVWDVETGKAIAELPIRSRQSKFYPPFDLRIKGASEAPFEIALSPDGALLALGGDDTLEIYTLPQ